MLKMRHICGAMRNGTFKMRERGCQMRHFRAIAQDLAALVLENATKPCQELERLTSFLVSAAVTSSSPDAAVTMANA